jgi:hypothetical protein
MIQVEETTDSELREETGYYKCSKLAVVKELGREPTPQEVQILKISYDQVCTIWRTLLDVRFKLLGLVPFVSVSVMLVTAPGTGAEVILRGTSLSIVGGVGLLATLGLIIYEARNSELYNDLISRGRRIEAEIGLQNGIFLGRPGAKVKVISHTPAIFLVYFASLLGWLYVIFHSA